jgi:hypothetical protein
MNTHLSSKGICSHLPSAQPTDTAEESEADLEAFLILARVLGRQAARDWLSADIYPSEMADDA